MWSVSCVESKDMHMRMLYRWASQTLWRGRSLLILRSFFYKSKTHKHLSYFTVSEIQLNTYGIKEVCISVWLSLSVICLCKVETSFVWYPLFTSFSDSVIISALPYTFFTLSFPHHLCVRCLFLKQGWVDRLVITYPTNLWVKIDKCSPCYMFPCYFYKTGKENIVFMALLKNLALKGALFYPIIFFTEDKIVLTIYFVYKYNSFCAQKWFCPSTSELVRSEVFTIWEATT